MKCERRFVILPLLCFCLAGFLSGCGGGGSEATSLAPIESVHVYDPEAEETKFEDFSLLYYPEKGGYFVGDYKGGESAIAIPDEATGEDGVKAPIVGLTDNAFYGRQDLKTVVLGKNLRYIGDYAFAQSGVTDLRVDLGLADIAKNAFADSDVRFYEWNGRKYLPSLDNPYFLTFHSKYSGVYGLSPDTKCIVFDKGTTIIEEGVYDATALPVPAIESVGLPDGVIEIMNSAFKGCSSLKQLHLPNTLQTILGGAFTGCTSLKTLVIPDSVKSIGNAFGRCTGLESVVLSKEIGNEFSFSGCTSLKKLVVPEGVTSIGRYAFENCSSLEEIELPSTLKSIGHDAFDGCPATLFHEYEGLNYIGPKENPYFFLYEKAGDTPEVCHIHPDCKIIGEEACAVDDATKEIVIPAGCNVRQQAITGLNGGNSALTKITFLGVPRSVDRESFFYCVSLAFSSYGVARYLGNDENPYMVLYDVPDETAEGELIHPDCNLISGSAFRRKTRGVNPPLDQTFWPKLTSIVIPSKVQRICENAFYEVRFTGPLVIEDAPVAIDDGAFASLSLSSVSLGNALTAIGAHAFAGEANLTSVSVPATCSFLGEGAFRGCSKLGSISLPNSIAAISAECFAETAITSFSVPSSVAEIEDYAFGGCQSLESIYIPSSVKTIKEHAFINCNALRNVYAEASSKPAGWLCSFGNATVTYGYQPD